MLRIRLAFLGVLPGLLLQAGLAWGANIKIDQLRAQPFSQFVTLHGSDVNPSGAVETFTPPPGSVLYLVDFRVTPEWDEATTDMNFDNDSFGLYDGETKLEALGSMAEFGLVQRYVSVPYLYRSDDWKTEPPRSVRSRMWVVAPKETKEAQLRLTMLVYSKEDPDAEPKKTPYTANVKLEGEPKPFDFTDYVEVTVRRMKMLESIEVKDEYDAKRRPTRIVNEGGSIMQLTLQLTPKRSNSLESEDFEWSPAWIGLSFGRGGRAVCLGTMQYGAVTSRTSEVIEKTDADIWDSKTISLYYPVPSNLRSFDITFLGQKVAQSAVEQTTP